MHKIRIIFCLLTIFSILFYLTGCREVSTDTSPIKINGSTTLYDLCKTWANVFMKENPGIVIEVGKSGTKNGIEMFLNGECDIVETSRRLTTEEIFRARKAGVKVEEFCAGFTIYTVAVNIDNPISKLNEDQVKRIFLGRIRNWKEIGGEDREIVVLYHSVGKDQYDYFLEKYLNLSANIDLNNLPSNIIIINSPKEVVKKIAEEKGAIGYYYLYDDVSGTKALGIAKTGSVKYRMPVMENAIIGEYPILRPYFLYKNRSSAKPLNKFIDFIYSDEGINITKRFHFVPVPESGSQHERNVLFEYI